jgi:hypothetical protein
VGVADDEAGVGLLDGPGRREAAWFGLVDHRTIADPRLQAAQGRRCDADLRRERPRQWGCIAGASCVRVAGGPVSGGSLKPGAS